MAKAKRSLDFSSENSDNVPEQPGIIVFTMISKDAFSERIITLKNGKKILIHKEDNNAFMKHEIKNDNLVFNSEGLTSGHAVLSFEKQEFYLNDLFSNSGTYIDGRKLKPNLRCILHSGQKVNFGHGIIAKVKILSPNCTIRPPLALLGNKTKINGSQENDFNIQNDKEDSPQQISSVTFTKGKHYQ